MKKTIDFKEQPTSNLSRAMDNLSAKLSNFGDITNRKDKNGSEYFQWRNLKIYQAEDKILVAKLKSPEEVIIEIDPKEKTIKIIKKLEKEALMLFLETNISLYSKE